MVAWLCRVVPTRVGTVVAVAAFLLGLSPPSVAAAEPAGESAQEIVDRAIAFHGGDRYESSRVSLTLRSRSGAFRLEVLTDGARFEHTVDTGQRRVRATNEGVEVWEAGVAVPIPPERVQGYRDFVSARTYFPFLPYRLNDTSVHKKDLGSEVWDGRSLRKIKVSFEVESSTDAGDEYLYWFDPETARLEQLAYSFQTGGGGLRLRKAFNFRRVGGILFSDQENFGIDGKGMSVDVLTPQYLAEKMQHISTVALEDIEVEPLEAGR